MSAAQYTVLSTVAERYHAEQGLGLLKELAGKEQHKVGSVANLVRQVVP